MLMVTDKPRTYSKIQLVRVFILQILICLICNVKGHVDEYPTMHYFENTRLSVNDSSQNHILYDF